MGHAPSRHALLDPAQAAAAKREDHATVARALGIFTPAMLTQALRLLKADALSRSEKFIGPVTWLATLHADRAKAADGRQRDNILWHAVATAPAGYCHPRASVAGTLLEDIAAGLPFKDIEARFAAKLHPLRYQRPQAAPTAGNIAQAEKVIQQMGLAPSLARRFARLDEVETVWRPLAATTLPTGSVFGHLRPKRGVPSVSLPPVTLTWEKFSRTVLAAGPDAIEFMVPAHGSFTGLLTATDFDAPPILKWDRPEARNPVSSYVYHNGSDPTRWGLCGGEWCARDRDNPAPERVGSVPADPSRPGGHPVARRGRRFATAGQCPVPGKPSRRTVSSARNDRGVLEIRRGDRPGRSRGLRVLHRARDDRRPAPGDDGG